MAKLSPVAEVKEKFGSKEALAQLVLKHVECPEGLSKEDFERKIRTISNRKLLKLHAVHEEVTKRFGSKDGLVDAIIAVVCKGKVDTVYKAKLQTLREAQLLDLHKSVSKKTAK